MKPAEARIEAARAELARVLGDVGAAQTAQLAPLVGGTHRRSWLVVVADGRRCVLRTPLPESSALLDIETEVRAMNEAAAAGVAPRVISFAPNGALLTEYRSGAPWTTADARHPRNMERLAAVLRALHGLRTELPTFHAERIASDYLAAAPVARDSHAAAWSDELLALAGRYDARFLPTAFCHNDLVAANVLDDGQLALVDFEYAVRADPLLDLANLAGMNGFNRAEQRALLAAYRRIAPTAEESAELAWLVRMVRLMAWFWALLGEANSPHPAPYAQYLAKLAADLRQD